MVRVSASEESVSLFPASNLPFSLPTNIVLCSNALLSSRVEARKIEINLMDQNM